ncbi:MAG: hypothetical protein QGG40_17290 [Myxococcota bacterium]|nr:hypothetical protein [Myxococcota bacterium]
MWDGWESRHGLDITSDDSGDDEDGDGLTNTEEFALGTSPSESDTDGDGAGDGSEVSAGTDPLAS